MRGWPAKARQRTVKPANPGRLMRHQSSGADGVVVAGWSAVPPAADAGVRRPEVGGTVVVGTNGDGRRRCCGTSCEHRGGGHDVRLCERGVADTVSLDTTSSDTVSLSGWLMAAAGESAPPSRAAAPGGGGAR
ncbi:MAG: hypothetical protein R2854_19695 [Caldilineaceae bacterium]